MDASLSSKVFWIDLIDLTKPRICVLALIMAALGFLLGTDTSVNVGRLIATLVGLGLVGAAAGAFNQYHEKDIDSLMWRTLNRPLPSGRLQDKHALGLGFIAGGFGLIVLLVGTNELTAVLGGLTLLSYIGLYTPSKKLTPLSTLVGAVPGALPPLMGFTAAHGGFGRMGFLLFLILFIWQIPHFLAIAWLYQEDYRRANLPILPVVDFDGLSTAKQVLLYNLVLIPLSLLPSFWGETGGIYPWGALFLGLAYLAAGGLLSFYRTRFFAKVLFTVSIIYLPLLGILLLGDKIS